MKITGDLATTIMMVVEMLGFKPPKKETDELDPEIPVVPVVGEEPDLTVPPQILEAEITIEQEEIAPSVIITKEEADVIRTEQEETLLYTPPDTLLTTTRTLSST